MSEGLALDAGALIAIERGDARVVRLLKAARDAGLAVSVTAGVIAQVWRGGPRQARLAALLAADGLDSADLDVVTAPAVGQLASLCGHADVVDVHVALDAHRRGHAVLTSDPDDLRAVLPELDLIEI